TEGSLEQLPRPQVQQHTGYIHIPPSREFHGPASKRVWHPAAMECHGLILEAKQLRMGGFTREWEAEGVCSVSTLAEEIIKFLEKGLPRPGAREAARSGSSKNNSTHISSRGQQQAFTRPTGLHGPASFKQQQRTSMRASRKGPSRREREDIHF
ncbi:hypothetical protein VIGAN_07109800, partial [Vigna angularis var. angularis]